MNRWIKILVATVLSLSVCFTFIGYAQLSDNLSVSGSAGFEVPSAVYITDVTVKDGADATVNHYTGTAMNTTITLGNSQSSTVSLEVSVFNNSGIDYVFKGTTYIEEAYDNSDISFALDGIVAENVDTATRGTPIATGETLTFTVTFSYSGAVSDNKTLNSVLNFDFGPESEIEEAVNTVSDAFKVILNTEVSFDSIIEQMVKNQEGYKDDTYIGNVVGASSEDTELVNKLFSEVNGGKGLTITINGEEVPVTAIIKRENVDSDPTTGDEDGREMVLYVTPDTLETEYTGGIFSRPIRYDVTVYAMVYTNNHYDSPDVGWYQIGEMYEGEATTSAYDGSWFDPNESFNTSDWTSTKAYYDNAAPSGSTITKIVTAYKNSIK